MMDDLVVHLARFARALRGSGVRVAMGDEADALAALVRVDVGDPDEVRWALRCALKIRPRDAATFEATFARMWLAAGGGRAAPQPQPPPVADHGPGRPRAPAAWPMPAMHDGEGEAADPDGNEPGASREALFRRKSFEDCDERDLAAMEPILAELAENLATRRSRRLRPTRGRGAWDLRRSLRRSLATGGELLSLARRARPIETPKLVFLCDTSGSMEMHSQFLLAFARALRRVAKATETFAFNTELVRVTPWLAGPQERVLARLAEAVPDWSGGTRIGECLAAFVDRHLDELVDSRTVVIVFSDGLDRGDPETLAAALRRIRARARRVIWLNPLLSDPRYEPTARGMAAALPYVDRLAPAHDLDTLARIIPELTV
ncbi:MAG TPA: VWA domain-containing protein [Haliangiales bacterium]|nr:VWA domain-containing protein [Haliangiales bacterium]